MDNYEYKILDNFNKIIAFNNNKNFTQNDDIKYYEILYPIAKFVANIEMISYSDFQFIDKYILKFASTCTTLEDIIECFSMNGNNSILKKRIELLCKLNLIDAYDGLYTITENGKKSLEKNCIVYSDNISNNIWNNVQLDLLNERIISPKELFKEEDFAEVTHKFPKIVNNKNEFEFNNLANDIIKKYNKKIDEDNFLFDVNVKKIADLTFDSINYVKLDAIESNNKIYIYSLRNNNINLFSVVEKNDNFTYSNYYNFNINNAYITENIIPINIDNNTYKISDIKEMNENINLEFLFSIYYELLYYNNRLTLFLYQIQGKGNGNNLSYRQVLKLKENNSMKCTLYDIFMYTSSYYILNELKDTIAFDEKDSNKIKEGYTTSVCKRYLSKIDKRDIINKCIKLFKEAFKDKEEFTIKNNKIQEIYKSRDSLKNIIKNYTQKF